MGHSYVCNYMHCVFSTKDRKPTISDEMQEKLWAYIYGIARNHKIELLAIGGVADHVHLLICVPPKMPVAEVVQKLKANSSRWMGERGTRFSWQEGYGGFSVSASQLPAVKEYIRTQPEHHKRHSFEEEFIALLVKYGIPFNRSDVFG